LKGDVALMQIKQRRKEYLDLYIASSELIMVGPGKDRVAIDHEEITYETQ
jgi:hypothetical protein